MRPGAGQRVQRPDRILPGSDRSAPLALGQHALSSMTAVVASPPLAALLDALLICLDLPRVGDEPLGTATAPRPRSADDLSAETMAALASLSPDHRAVVVLRYVLDYSPGEIAELLELPRGTVNSRLRRGLDALQVHVVKEQP